MTLVHLPDGTDWLMKPVLRGLCGYEGLVDGTLGVEDVARMNDALSTYDENMRRIRAASKGSG